MSDNFEKLILGGGTDDTAAAKADVPLFLQEDDSEPPAQHDFFSDLASPHQHQHHRVSPHSVNTGRATTTAAAGAAADTLSPSPEGQGGAVVLSSAERLCFTSAPVDGLSVVYDLRRERILGKGNFGCATLYRNAGAVRNTYVVVKDINLQAMASERESEVESLVSEIALLQEVKGHPNCLRIFDFFASSSSRSSGAPADDAAHHTTGTAAAAAAGRHPREEASSAAKVNCFQDVLLNKSTKMAYLLTEFCGGGDLAGVIEQQRMPRAAAGVGARFENANDPKFFSEAFVASLLIQLLVVLHHLHEERKIIHRDVKPQNLFFREDGVSLRLGDFGIAYSEVRSGQYAVNYASSQLVSAKQRLSSAHAGARPTTAGSGGHVGAVASGGGGGGSTNNANVNNNNRKQVKGTPFYMAPELFRESGSYTFAVDMWSAGVLLYEMVCLEKPFLASNYQGLSQRVVAGRCLPLREREELRASSPDALYSNDLLDIIMSLLVTDPQLRPSARRLLKKSFVKKMLWTVPRTLLMSPVYIKLFGEEAVQTALAACVFTGVAEVQDEVGVPGAAAHREGQKREEEAAADRPVEPEYEDDFESSDDDDE